MMEDPVTNEFPDEAVNVDMSDSANLPQRQPNVHPLIPTLARSRSIIKGDIGWHSQTPRTARTPGQGRLTATLTFPPLARSTTDLGDRLKHGLRRRTKSPTPNYTMINRRELKSAGPTAFNALNRTFKPIPSLLEKSAADKEFARKSIRLWENEVKKVVPSRPAFAIKSDWVAPPADWDDRDQYIYGPKSIFYKNLKYVTEKDFTINPEWLSESMTVSSNSQAYRTCALRYGWCC